jgi:hypothetical protein
MIWKIGARVKESTICHAIFHMGMPPKSASWAAVEYIAAHEPSAQFITPKINNHLGMTNGCSRMQSIYSELGGVDQLSSI